MHTLTPEQICSYRQNGYLIVSKSLDPISIESFREEFQRHHTQQSTKRGSSIYGVRNVLEDFDTVRTLAHSAQYALWLKQLLITDAFPTRGLYFDKLDGANWHLPWHQDLAIAVKKKIDTEGYHGWSMKEGVTHVIPPLPILENRIAMRFHLDDCGIENGALNVLPGSHRHGKLSHQDLTQWTEGHSAVPCTCNKGDVLIIHPLVLHASSPAISPTHRRVIHIEYATLPLDGNLEWHYHKHP